MKWRNYGGWMVDNGLLERTPDVNEALTNELLPGEGCSPLEGQLLRPSRCTSTRNERVPTTRAAQLAPAPRRPTVTAGAARIARRRRNDQALGRDAARGDGDRAARQRQRRAAACGAARGPGTGRATGHGGVLQLPVVSWSADIEGAV